ncbi:MAG: tetratricopeptide repeat protein [Pseudomonadota bacterium]
MLGLVRSMTGDNAAARVALERAVRLQPGNAMLRNNLGCVLRALGETAAAATQFREAVALRPDYVSANVNLGVALIDGGHYTEAERVLRAVLALAPEHPEALNNLGTSLRQQGHYREATGYYRRALRAQPHYPDALANLGMSLLFDNNPVDAETCLRRALAVAPQHTGALYYLGFLLHKRKALAEAEDCFRRILTIEPGHVNAAYFLSVIGASEAPPRSPVNYVEELFDGYANSFEAHLVGTLQYSAPEVMNRLVRGALGQNHQLLDTLDLGCGTGLCARQFTDITRSLTGVDLSQRMLDKAGELKIYDRLVKEDVGTFLAGQAGVWDLILAGDLFTYIGDLRSLLHACALALRDGGLMSLSIEKHEGQQPYVLRESGRYAQNPGHVTQLAAERGLRTLSTEQFVLRKEFGEDIIGLVFVLAKGGKSG